jgi:pre-rRNA-processing protein TSR2
LFAQRPQTDEQDLEEVLLQVMDDEFCAVVEDGSERVVARAMVRVREECMRGEFAGVRRLEGEWRAGRGQEVKGVEVQGEEEEESEEDDEDEDDEDGDIDMADDDEVPQLVESKKRIEPEVDEDGFTKVVNRRRK